jgi:type VI secretion system protein ImpC
MANRADVRIDLSPAEEYVADPRVREEPAFRLAILGDFSGRAGRGALRDSFGELRPVLVDRDDLDAVLASLAPRIALDLPGAPAPVELRFAAIEDFHPDALFRQAALFRELRELRRKASDPSGWRSVAAQLRGEPSTASGSPPSPSRPPTPGDGGVLGMILDETEPETAAEARPSVAVADENDLREYIRRIVAPFLVANPDPRQADLRSRLGETIAEQMRAVLHHPRFQALESLWRAVELLVRRVETSVTLRIYLVDLAREEIEADLGSGSTTSTSAVRRLFAGSGGVGEPWSLVVGAWSFGPAEADLQLLRSLGAAAGDAGVSFIAAAEPTLTGIPTFEGRPDSARWTEPLPGWEELRRQPAATSLGLVQPRFLLRLPYGEDSDPCDDLAFEELTGPPLHHQYLWGNPAIACALLLATSFARSGWQMRPGEDRDLTGLPLHVVRNDGDPSATPTAETLMTEELAEHILDAGVMPLASLRDSDRSRILRFQSAAAPPAPLAGPWTASH